MTSADAVVPVRGKNRFNPQRHFVLLQVDADQTCAHGRLNLPAIVVGNSREHFQLLFGVPAEQPREGRGFDAAQSARLRDGYGAAFLIMLPCSKRRSGPRFAQNALCVSHAVSYRYGFRAAQRGFEFAF
jgi:hypothetical protein